MSYKVNPSYPTTFIDKRPVNAKFKKSKPKRKLTISPELPQKEQEPENRRVFIQKMHNYEFSWEDSFSTERSSIASKSKFSSTFMLHSASINSQSTQKLFNDSASFLKDND